MGAPPPPPPLPGAPVPPPPPGFPGGAGKIVKGLYPNKRKIETKYKLPRLNWVTIPPTQISGTVFTQIDDEKILKSLDFTDFEEEFKVKGQEAGPMAFAQNKPERSLTKREPTLSLLEPNRSQNVAIAKKKVTHTNEELKQAITTMDLEHLPLEMVEILNKITPNEDEQKKFVQFSKDKKNPVSLPDNDRFLYELQQIDRLKVRLQVMIFMGNFEEDMSLMIPQVDAVIAASKSLVASENFKKVLEIILAFGNYMNSSRRGGAYGFKLQSLDILMDTRSPSDRNYTLMHHIARVVRNKYPEIVNFVHELTYLEKAATVSLDLLAADIRLVAKGMKEATAELINNKHNKPLKKFCLSAEPRVTKLEGDLVTAKEAFSEVVVYFGENQKTSQPNAIFPILQRFVDGFVRADGENLAKMTLRKAHLFALESQAQDESEDDKGVDVLPQIYDGAIDEIITGMKTNAYRPAGYRRNTLTRQTSGASNMGNTSQDELLQSLKRRTKADPYSANRPWLK